VTRRRRAGRSALVLAVALIVPATVVLGVTLVSIDEAATVGRAAVRVTVTSSVPPSVPPSVPAGRSLRLFGTGTDDIDRVKIPLGAGTRANVGAGDVTIELWVKGRLADNPATGCSSSDAAWITGHVVVDRDVYGPGDRGDFGLSLLGGRVAWGASLGGAGATACGQANVLDGAWHHVAVTRRAANGRLQVWVDGALDADVTTSPAVGDISYRIGRSTSWPASDPYLVFGAEKHDAGPEYPSFAGWIDDVRISTVIRYTAPFVRPTAPHPVDAATAALYRFDEPGGSTVVDAVGTSPGELRVGGPNAAPIRTADTPFAAP
jgi:hypothetical protein